MPKLLLLLTPLVLTLSHCSYSKCVACKVLDYAIEREERREEARQQWEYNLEEHKRLQDQSFMDERTETY